MSPLSVGLGWLAMGPIVLGLAYACMRIEEWAAKKSAAAQETTNPAPQRNQCDTNGCGYPALVWEIVHPQHGGGLRWVCIGCHNEGAKFGWWKKTLPATATALDFMVEDETRDLDSIDQLAQEWARGDAS